MIYITLILPAHTPACVLFSTCERERGTINMVKKSIRGHVDVGLDAWYIVSLV